MPAGVYTRSEEWKEKASEWLSPTQFKNGQPAWNKGIKWTRGPNKKPRTAEWKIKQSNAHIGKKAWNRGITGSKSHAWKGGLSALTERIRISYRYGEWRAKVFLRDGWTCQTCGLRGHGMDIEAHHILPMRELLNEARIKGLSTDDQYLIAVAIPDMFNVSNGVTLCKSCHIQTFKGERT